MYAVKDYVRYLRTQGLTVHKVYLYGSYAADRAHEESDVDVAVISSDFRNDMEALQYLWAHLREEDIRRRLEPVGFTPRTFNPKTNPLASAVYHEGKEVKV